MAADYLHQKIDAIFDLYDHNGDGFLENSELTGMVERYREHFNVPRDAAKYTDAIRLSQEIWQRIQSAGTDSDNKINKREWYAAYADPSFVDQVVVPLSLLVFDLADTDGDGQLSKDEALAAFRLDGLSEADAAEAFRRLDADHDGYLTKQEIEQATRELVSSNRKAAGDVLVGSV
ncbi:EF-hand domain-containing protein [Embleya sp. AB8]|uniref:EF-hand domain-containing protein n=1 Tax=Embleya sp. AB8 TaxID=3156304 RepID=UPI003C77CC33